MRVWQPGGHLTMQRGAEVDDWSWRRTAPPRLDARTPDGAVQGTARRSRSARCSRATLTALAPPYLAKVAIDDGIRGATSTC